MANKGLGLLISSIFVALMLAGIVIAANSINPASGEVGTEVTVTLDGVTANADYTIYFNGTTTGVTIHTDASGDGSAKITAPEKSADTYKIDVKDATNTIIYSENFAVTNSKPVINSDSFTTYVGSTSIGSATVTDKNGKELASCSVSASTDLVINGNIQATVNSAKDACILSFKDGKAPSSSSVGDHTLNLTVTDAKGLASGTASITVNIKDYLEIGTIKLKDKTGNTDHMPGDIIELTVEIQNNLNKDLENIVLTVENSNLDVDVDSDEIDIDAEDDSTVTVEFQIPYDAEEGTFGLDLTADGEDEDGADRSAEESYDIKVEKDTHSLAIVDVEVDEGLSCGRNGELSFRLVNNGEKDESDILVTIKNIELGIDEALETFDLDAGDEETISFEFEIPEKGYDKTFEITIDAKYSSVYTTVKPELTISGCEALLFTAPETIISNPGDESELLLTIENIGSDDLDYEVKIIDLDKETATYTGELKKISIGPGEVKEVRVKINTNESTAVGEYDFTAELYLKGAKIASKDVKLIVEEGGLLTGLAVFGGNGGEIGLSVLIILAVGVAGYFAYTLYFKKMVNKAEPSEDEEDDSNIQFDDENPKKKRKR